MTIGSKDLARECSHGARVGVLLLFDDSCSLLAGHFLASPKLEEAAPAITCDGIQRGCVLQHQPFI